MPNLTHKYQSTVTYAGGRDGKGEITNHRSNQAYNIDVPPEFGGLGEKTNPEELLTSAITGCYSVTYGIVSANRKLPVVGIKTESEGEVDQNGMTFVYKRITLRPTITLANDATDEQMAIALDMAHKADAYCIVTNTVRDKVEILLEPTVVRAE